MAWTNFASLGTGPGTTPQLDANFSALSQLVSIGCTVSGTNALTLTQITATAALTYQNYLELSGVAAATNTGAVTANFATLGALNVYKDTASGPALLVGGEIVQNCEFGLIYDSTLNSNAGGFHLTQGGNQYAGATITAASINATLGSINSLSVANLYGASASLVSMSIGNVQIAGGNVNASVASLTSLSIGAGGIALGTGADPILRVLAIAPTFTITSGNVLSPGQAVQSTISFANTQVGDFVVIGYPSGISPSVSLGYSAFISAAGSVVFRAANIAPAATTITVSIFSLRFMATGLSL